VTGSREGSLEKASSVQALRRLGSLSAVLQSFIPPEGISLSAEQWDRRLPHQAVSKNKLPSCAQSWHMLRASSWHCPCPGWLCLGSV
jgi:hypothetical protein